jgi:glycine/serine hydroxymethyltransferase
MGTEEMYKIGELISYTLKNRGNKTKLDGAHKKVKELVSNFPVYTDI